MNVLKSLEQNVMLAVARAVGRWRPDGNRGKFRTWLVRIARNQLIDVSRKTSRNLVARGGTSMLGTLDELSAGEGGLVKDAHLTHRRELFRWAADRVRSSVKDETWQAFWLTAIDECSVEVVADKLSLSVGAVYIARSRVFARLRDEVKKWEGDDAV